MSSRKFSELAIMILNASTVSPHMRDSSTFLALTYILKMKIAPPSQGMAVNNMKITQLGVETFSPPPPT